MTPERAKAFGAFYTDAVVAEFLVRWAVRDAGDTVLDPSFGGGVFLEAGAARVAKLGGRPEQQVYGVELDEDAYTRVAQELASCSPANLILSDFFAVDPKALPPLGAVVGNPPFIRYQSFAGGGRALAAQRARVQGVALTQLASSWAAFIVHAAAFLKPGGRLGMVVPAELGHAAYAQPVLDFLTQTFGRVSLLTFRERLFPNISQDTLLLLAEAKGSVPEGLFWRDLRDAEALRNPVDAVLEGLERLPNATMGGSREKLVRRFIPTEARALYQTLAHHPRVQTLGTLADVGIGYVTGANAFFHLSPERAEALGLPTEHLRRAVFRGAALSGLAFTEADWQDASVTKNAGYLLHVVGDELTHELSTELAAYLETDEAQRAQGAYKCRVRSPWYVVPHVHTPDALLTYMSGLRAQLVANPAGAVAPNTLHVVRLRPDAPLSADTLAACWQTSLTSLSVELEGHALGGGMLKLELSEARRVLVAAPPGDFGGLGAELDTLLRQGRSDEAQQLADRAFLQAGLGLSEGECATMYAAAQSLRERRYYRGKVRAANGKSPASPPPPPAS